MKSTRPAQILIPLLAALSLTPWISSSTGLLMGIVVALVFGNPYAVRIKSVTHRLLGLAIVGLGAGMNLNVVGQVGLHGVAYTIVGIGTAFVLGTAIGRLLGTERDTSLLITVGTAICGGSAIAAVAPIIRAKHHEVSVALGIVFILNAVALFLFTPIGHYLSLSESQFGLWSALAIHDTSSVVGATLQYGAHALEVGTTVKLARALWIVPVTIAIGFLRSREKNEKTPAGKSKRPWFILGFIVAAALVTWVPDLKPIGHVVEGFAKHLMVLTLFLIGSSLTRETLKSVGAKPFIQGLILWILMASGSLGAIYSGLIN